MTAGDMQMVARTIEPGWTNLAIGEPRFLQHALRSFYPEYTSIGDIKYPPCNGEWTLRSLLRDVTPGPRRDQGSVVVTNGAKQALAATFYAMHKVRRACTAGAPMAPYWPSLPTLARMNKLAWSDGNPAPAHVEVLTWPNNPTGMKPGYLTANRGTGLRVWDAVYASEVYGWPDYDAGPEADAVICSAAKMFGLSGLRVGWVAFADQKLADAAAEYVELTTSGVSAPAQESLFQMLGKAADDHEGITACFHRAAVLLARSQRIFNGLLTPHVDDVAGLPAGHGGMFAWFRPKDSVWFALALQQAKVMLVDGVHCGVPGYYRMSLGVLPEELEHALERLVKALEAGR